MQKLGYLFQPSFALAKILWLQRHEPEVFRDTVWFVHHADYVLGQLTGQPGVSDYSNALKTGYDLLDECWPSWIRDRWPLTDRLPEIERRRGQAVCVLASGDPLHFGIADLLLKHFPLAEVAIHPALSAFTLATARLGWNRRDLTGDTEPEHVRPEAVPLGGLIQACGLDIDIGGLRAEMREDAPEIGAGQMLGEKGRPIVQSHRAAT